MDKLEIILDPARRIPSTHWGPLPKIKTVCIGIPEAERPPSNSGKTTRPK